jgi:hypothetical protein
MKLALLIGINYTGTNNQLNGCINDVNNIKNYLITTRGYLEEHITILTDNTVIKPSRNNILLAIDTLIEKSQENLETDCKELFFHYSGHGTFINDTDNNEQDGNDECIVGCDNNVIVDDELYTRFVSRVGNIKTICIIDACHSGSALDLPYEYNFTLHKWKLISNVPVNTNVLLISGCKDSEVSMDAFIDQKYQGALTNAFLHAIKKCKSDNLFEFVSFIRRYLKVNRYNQTPQLSCTKELYKWI